MCAEFKEKKLFALVQECRPYEKLPSKLKYLDFSLEYNGKKFKVNAGYLGEKLYGVTITPSGNGPDPSFKLEKFQDGKVHAGVINKTVTFFFENNHSAIRHPGLDWEALWEQLEKVELK